MSERNQNRASSRQQNASGGRRVPQQEQRAKRRRRKRPIAATIIIRFLQTIGTLLLIGIVTASFVACYAAVYIKTAVMPGATLDLSTYTLNENSVIYYYDKETGDPVEWVTLVGKENRERVEYESIPQDLIDAFVAIEDKRFWQHQGVDWYRTAGAFVNMFLGMRNTFGGSTITQQLVKNMTEYDDVTVTRKIQEIFTALDVENSYKKEEILEEYLNWIFFGNGCYGVQAAAKFYFNKDVSELTLAECASLAGITNNPSLYSPNAPLSVTRYLCKTCEENGLTVYSLYKDEPCATCGEEHYHNGEIWTGREYNKYRQELVLKNMADPEISPGGAYITQAEYDAAVAETLVFSWDVQDSDGDGADDDPDEDTTIYPWYVDAVISEVITDLMEQTGMTKEVVTQMVYSGGLKIYVPYDPEIQAKVDQIYNDRSNLDYTSKTGQQMSSAITVIDNSSGYVVAIAGDVGEKEVNRGWNNALSNQQPGSSIKPLSVYSPAVDMGLITPATIIDDNPMLMENEKGEEDDTVWPLNMPRGYRGLTTVMDGVVRSVNTIAVRVLQQVTPQASYDFMTQKYGITTLEPGRWNSAGQWKTDIDYSPLAMGGLTDGVNTFQMAAAYATFARNGVHTEATTYLRIEDIDGHLIRDNTPETNYVIQDSTAYYINNMLTNAVNTGTGYRAKIDGQIVAGKTGTTDASFDLWFCGYTSYYTAAVWTGYPYDEYLGNISNPSVTLWQKVMALVHEDLPTQDFAQPEDLIAYNICKDCGALATSSCENDLRGSRVQTFNLIRGDGPTTYCNCHVTVKICTECPILDVNGVETGAYHQATEYCPEESVKEVTMVDYTRVLAREDVVVTDYYALMSIYDTLEDPYCTVHTEPEPSDDPWWPWDPPYPSDDPEASDNWWDIDWPWLPDDDPEPEPTEDVQPEPSVEPEPDPVPEA